MLTRLLIDRSYASVRSLAEVLGRTVEWDEGSKTVTLE
ncbi:stalk domain-containing protein [Desulforamulus ruminis]|nr:stalk domain-containing protein [Desulforamulus ruminis]